jgi:hypothetical protein
VHLHVLARREVQEVVAEVGVGDRTVGEVRGDPAYDLRLLGRQDAARHLHAHHEGVAALFLGVDPDPLEALDLAGNLAHGREIPGIGVYYRPVDLERVPLELYLLDLVEGLALPEKTHVESNLL